MIKQAFFNRVAKRNVTTIRGGKLLKKIIGYDANALYLWALGNEMPCGRLTTIEAYDGIIEDIKADKVFGFLGCDIRTPEHLKEYFSEMTPVFKNIEIDCNNENVIGSHIFIKASSYKAIRPFMEAVSDARRDGDVDKSKEMIADMMKLVGNAAFGRSGMDKSKHKEVKYEPDCVKIRAIVERQNFHDVEKLAGTYEVSLKKRRIKFDNPIHLSIAIYQLAKLRTLQFYYDCIDIYFDRCDFQYQEMDTDSAYIASSCEKPFEECIKPEILNHFKDHKRSSVAMLWSVLLKELLLLPRDENDKQTKLPTVKVSAMGVQKSLNQGALSPDNFENVVKTRNSIEGTNKGFRICSETKSMITYRQQKTALDYF
ncbi:unnamed protein product [Phytophthora lilii]|uniref:Unnamed protein product n=1 Tax=Phytophthora lilii TaxID=2077276 RepID=A0A9W6TT37_9STRA|nr:unnamed protein product [Phytophthora lilii]